ncbi:MAG: hypothetical protein NTY25_11360 [Planctomycetia bacterium]|nr:hypothetical protein [Planctomycetia bacterium]
MPDDPASVLAPPVSQGLPTATVFLKPKRARPFFGRHPWVLDAAVMRVEGQPADGDVVDLATHDGTFIARGLWNAESRLRVRLFTFDSGVHLNAALWHQRLASAVGLRRSLGLDGRNRAARIVNSEGDGLSGLTVDRYADFLAVQVTSLAMANRLDIFCDSLQSLLEPKGILLRGAERGLAKLEGLHLIDRLLRGTAPAGPIFIEENGLQFGVDLEEGQKTGFYRGRPAACWQSIPAQRRRHWPRPTRI